MASQYGVGKHPNSLANLQPKKPGYTPDPEVVKKAARIGGEKRHKRRLMRDAMKDILSSGLIDLDGDEQIAALHTAGIVADARDLRIAGGGRGENVYSFENFRKLHGTSS